MTDVKYDVVTVKMKLHVTKDYVPIIIKEINVLTHADDGSIVIKDRDDMILCIRIMKESMAKWVLMTHAWTSEKNLKLKFCA